jgi:hypothetical protein
VRKALIRIFAALVICAVLVVGAVFLLSNTDWGREQVSKKNLATLQES